MYLGLLVVEQLKTSLIVNGMCICCASAEEQNSHYWHWVLRHCGLARALAVVRAARTVVLHYIVIYDDPSCISFCCMLWVSARALVAVVAHQCTSHMPCISLCISLCTKWVAVSKFQGSMIALHRRLTQCWIEQYR